MNSAVADCRRAFETALGKFSQPNEIIMVDAFWSLMPGPNGQPQPLISVLAAMANPLIGGPPLTNLAPGVNWRYATDADWNELAMQMVASLRTMHAQILSGTN